MPVCAMGGWYYDEDADRSPFRREIREAMSQGDRAVQIQVGRYCIDDVERRIRAACAIVGKGGRVMVDANQVF